MADDDQDEIIESADVIVALLTENARLKRIEAAARKVANIFNETFDHVPRYEALAALRAELEKGNG